MNEEAEKILAEAVDKFEKEEEKNMFFFVENDLNKMFLYYIKHIDSMLPCICSVIDHRTHHTWLSPRVPLFLVLPHFDSITEQTHRNMEPIKLLN